VLWAMIACVVVRHVGGPRGPQAIPVGERHMRILWAGQGPVDLPSPNKVGSLIPWPGFEEEPPTGVAAL